MRPFARSRVVSVGSHSAIDALEVRQLLSVGQTAAAANPIVIQPAISATPLFGSSSPTGLSPSQVQSAYGLNQISFGSVTGNGAGQTIAIIDAYIDPNIASDLQKFDSQYGLQAPPSFTQYVQNGFLPTDAGWSLETALDVEWAHAMAPAANIVLVEAQPTLNDLFSAVSFASHLPGVSVVSMSWGASEFAGESAYDSIFTTPGRPQRRDVRGILGRLGHDGISVGLSQCPLGGRHDAERHEPGHLRFGITVERERHRHQSI